MHIMSFHHRINAYRTMWLIVYFDLPTGSKKERSDATKLRNKLLEDGFTMFQYSVYVRHCASRENATVHERRVKAIIPPKGQVALLRITDQQFGMMEIFYAEKKKPAPVGWKQLELF
jgi:CRISPR-associated protein Cas2